MSTGSWSDRWPRWRCAAAGAAALLLAGCETIAITALGVGASAGVSHTANGISTRTFTAPTAQVKAASLTALGRMGIRVESVERGDNGDLIKASSADRSIEIELEPMSKSTTQMRAVAKRALFLYDAATAKEIVVQTERALAAPPQRGKVAATAAPVRVAAGAP